MKAILALAGLVAFAGVALGQEPTEWPLHDNGLTDIVQWLGYRRLTLNYLSNARFRDHYSYQVNGERLFVFSGEV